MPSTKTVRISWAALTLSGVSASAISGRAGSMESIENAMVANIIAISATNSTRRMGREDMGRLVFLG